MKRLLWCGLAAIALFLSPVVRADEADVRKAVQAWLGASAKVDAVRKAGFMNLYEVQVGGDIIYADEKGEHVVVGNVLDLKAHRNLTEEVKTKLARIKFSDLPLDIAVKRVKGNGRRLMATFEDPNCTYCKRLAKELQGITDVTIYTFVYPILSPDSADKARAIWCAPDRAKAWTDLMLDGDVPPEGKCDAPINKVIALGQKLNVHGTPTIFLGDGNRIPGFASAAQLDQAITKAMADAK